MKRIFLCIIFCLLPIIASASGQQQLLSRLARVNVATGGGEPTPDYEVALDDNTTGTTVVATNDSESLGDATLIGEANTSDVHTATALEGTGAFDLPAQTDGIRGKGYTTWLNDEIFTLQFAVKGEGTAQYAAYARLYTDSTEAAIRVRIDNTDDTLLRVLVGGTEVAGLLVNSNGLDDGNWHCVRVVIDTGGTHKMNVYEGATCASLTLRSYSDAALGDINSTPDTSINVYYGVGGGSTQGWAGIIDDVKTWDSAVYP